MDHRALVDLARSQHGIISSRQARKLGAGEDAVHRLVASGRWRQVRRGIYAVGAAEETWELRVMAACLAAGPDAVAGSRTAARHWGLIDRSGRIELLIGGRRRVRLAGVTVHRTLLLPPMDREIRSAIPVTSLPRTLIDASAGQAPTVVSTWIDRAMRVHGMPLEELRSGLARLAGPGRRDVRAIREALDLGADTLGVGDSTFEARVCRVIAQAGLPEPVLQHPVLRPDGRQALIDVAYPWAMVAIEPEGFEFHRDRAAFDHDRLRSTELTLLGWDVYRLTTTMSDAYIAATIREALAKAAGGTIASKPPSAN